MMRVSSLPVCVLGLGLIGGSLVRRAAPDRAVFGWSPSERTRAAAAADGFEVEASLEAALTRAADADALVVLAAPLTAMGELIMAVDRLAPTIRLTDVASVKAPVVEQVAELAPRARFIGGHPMAGTQHSGWPAGSAALFEGAVWVTVLDEDSDLPTWADVADLALACGSRVVPAEAVPHDAAVARISHLPHLLALALAQVGAESALARSLAASSFADGTRVAATRPELIRAMCESNRAELVGAVDDFLGVLGVARGSLASTGSLVKLTEAGHAARLAFQARDQGLEALQLAGPDLIEELLAVGASGGAVTGVHRSVDGLRVTATYPADT